MPLTVRNALLLLGNGVVSDAVEGQVVERRQCVEHKLIFC